MVQKLHLDGLILEVLELVSHDKLIRPGNRRDAGLHANLRAKDAGLFHMAFDGDFMRR